MDKYGVFYGYFNHLQSVGLWMIGAQSTAFSTLTKARICGLLKSLIRALNYAAITPKVLVLNRVMLIISLNRERPVGLVPRMQAG